MIRALSAFAVLVFAATAVLAQSDVSAGRKHLMKTINKYGHTTLTHMVRGETPYDQAKVDDALTQLTKNVPKIPDFFPAGGYQGPVADDHYYAAAKAFESQSDIKARVEKLEKAVAAVQGKIKDLASLKATWPDIEKNNCDACHKEYRVRAAG
jgi:cytochrome c556